MKNVLLLLCMTMMGSVASLFLKRASASSNIKTLIGNYNLYMGGGLYLLSAIMNIILLRYMEYSVVLPLTSITYIWTLVIAKLFLGEKITQRKVAGVALILIGAIIISHQ
jgi:drug/metabolite transporter (DMT)-like permease